MLNSLRKRVQRRSVKAYKSPGGQWRVVLPGDENDGTTVDADASPVTIDETAQAVTEAQRRVGGLEAVQEILAPFIAELGTVHEVLGREKQRRESAKRERDQLRLEVARLRSLLRRDPQPAPVASELRQSWHESAAEASR
jgi:hypothetical protein